MVVYEWRGAFANGEVETLHAKGFRRDPDLSYDWVGQVETHSLGWVCARRDGELVGWVNVVWDGFTHAFILDTVVSTDAGREGIGTELVRVAVGAARDAGCEWLHVDFEDQLRPFYFGACGFVPTNAGLIEL